MKISCMCTFKIRDFGSTLILGKSSSANQAKPAALIARQGVPS
jgi:hypothetical protein